MVSSAGRAEPSRSTPPALLSGAEPVYSSPLGAAYCGDGAHLLEALPDSSVALVVTSPPYAWHFKKEYGNVEKSSYVEWFRPFSEQISIGRFLLRSPLTADNGVDAGELNISIMFG